MLKLSLIELFLRLIPEGFILALSIYAFSNIEIDRKRLIISGIILSINPYFIRMLPISFGVHTILLIMLYILVAVNINHIDIIKSIKSGLLAYIILALCDLADFVLVVNILNVPIEKFAGEVQWKMLLGAPSLILFFIIIYVFYKKNHKKTEVI